MRLRAPKQLTFIIAVILALVGVLAFLGALPGIGSVAFWLVVIGFVILALGNLMKGL